MVYKPLRRIAKTSIAIIFNLELICMIAVTCFACTSTDSWSETVYTDDQYITNSVIDTADIDSAYIDKLYYPNNTSIAIMEAGGTYEDCIYLDTSDRLIINGDEQLLFQYGNNKDIWLFGGGYGSSRKILIFGNSPDPYTAYDSGYIELRARYNDGTNHDMNATIQNVISDYDPATAFFNFSINSYPAFQVCYNADESPAYYNVQNSVTAFGYHFHPKAMIDILGGTTEVPSLRIRSGSLLNTPMGGAFEYDGDYLYFTSDNGTRYTVDLTEVP